MKNLLSLAFFISFWEAFARLLAWPAYFIPAPTRIFTQLTQDYAFLVADFIATARTSLAALLLAFVFAFFAATLTHVFKPARMVFAPLSLILQVTPIIALAPLLLIYFKPHSTTLIIAALIAFYPLFSGFLNGFKAASLPQTQLFTLYKASKWQKFKHLELPTSLPFLWAGVEVSSGLALVGTVVGEFSAGAGQGLAIRLLESQYRLNIPRVYACLVLIIALGFIFRALLAALKIYLPSVHGAVSRQ